MTDQETTKHSQDANDATAPLTASEGQTVVTSGLPAHPAPTENTPATKTTTASSDNQATGDALLAAIEAIVPSNTEVEGNSASGNSAAENSPTHTAPIDQAPIETTAAESSQAEVFTSVPVDANEAAPLVAVSGIETVVIGAAESAVPANDEVQVVLLTPPLVSAESVGSDSDATETVASVAPAAEEKPRIPFADLNLDARLQKGIDEQGFSHCTPIQSEALPHTLRGSDVIGKAQTGTGKTAAFLITIIQNLLTRPEQEERYNGEPRALILAPTRELALQIEKDAKPLLKNTPLNMVSIVGGMDYKKQQKRLQEEIIDIVVGTPGRLIDFVRGKDLFLSETEIVVIDEADRMLDMGFIPDVKRLVRETPYKTYRQTLLFSATFTQDIMNLSENWTTDPVRVEIEPESVASASVEQKIYIVTTEQKINVLYNLITQQNLDRVIVFVNRRDETRDLTTKLKALGLRVAMLSGEIPQHKRLRTLENFRNGRLRVMVATDVAGRGIHIEGISHVVNYTLPEDPEDYVHRIGRTGRAGATGTSVSFACEEDAFLIPAIETLLGEKILCTHPETELLAELPELIAE